MSLAPAAAPSSSRMLASYLTDIEQLLDEQRWDAALREACDLPRIAVALSDPQLRCSREEVGIWCAQWMPAKDAQDCPGGTAFAPLTRRARGATFGAGACPAPPAAAPSPANPAARLPLHARRDPRPAGEPRPWKRDLRSLVPHDAGMRAAAAMIRPCKVISPASQSCARRLSLKDRHPRDGRSSLCRVFAAAGPIGSS